MHSTKPQIQTVIIITTLKNKLPVSGHSRHCPGEANDAPDNSKQHCSKDSKLSLTDSPPQ